MPLFFISSASFPVIGRHWQLRACSRCHSSLCSSVGFRGILWARCHSLLSLDLVTGPPLQTATIGYFHSPTNLQRFAPLLTHSTSCIFMSLALVISATAYMYPPIMRHHSLLGVG